MQRIPVSICTTALLAAALLVSVPAAAQPARPATPPDISGEWRLENHEEAGQLGASGQPPLGDYTGIPFNDAGRQRADTTPESIWGTPEDQCRPHSAPHQWRGLGGARILKEEDPLTRGIRAYHIQFMRSLDRPVFMDGRPHPPAWAPHTWTGFSTGEWVGNTLKITTTHLKDGYLKRGGPQTSDLYSMTEFLTRHGDTLTITTVVDDPVYQDEPYVQSTTSTNRPRRSTSRRATHRRLPRTAARTVTGSRTSSRVRTRRGPSGSRPRTGCRKRRRAAASRPSTRNIARR
jgi:hypothetical protein